MYGRRGSPPLAQPENDEAIRPSRWRQQVQRVRIIVRRAAPFSAGVVTMLVALLLYRLLVPAPVPLTTRAVQDAVATALASATPAPAFSAQVYSAIQPSLMLIQVEAPDQNGSIERALGTGVIIDDQGDILTSLHVVARATSIRLTFADGTESTGQVMARQPDHDIAVVRADQPPARIVPAVLGNPHAMHIGDEAFAVGNPFGLYSSISAGVISGFGRSVKPIGSSQELTDLIQIDASVNPGNSGGPLLNRNGEVVGIVTGLVNPTDQNFFVGIGFAVPITIASTAAGAPPY